MWPAAVLIALAFAACGIAAITFMRTWTDFDMVTLATLPLFLFSATSYPLDTYSPAVQLVIRCTPLYQGVALCRALSLGAVSWATLGHVAYLVAMGALGWLVAAGRLSRLLLK